MSEQSFSFVEPKAWNSLPSNLRLVLQLPYCSSVTEEMHRHSAAALVVCGRPGELQDPPPCLQMSSQSDVWQPVRSRSVISALTFVGRDNMRASSRLDQQLCIPRIKTKTLDPRGFYYPLSVVWNSLPA